MNRLMWRSRWAAVGAAVAVSVGGGGVFLASAAPGPTESTIVMVTPARVLDTRDPVNLGLDGPLVSAVSQKLQITGSVQTAGGTATVVPAGATGVLLNVTAVSPTANGFISIRPGDASGTRSTSSLNVQTGSILPNAVQVALPTGGANAGKIDITWDAYGTGGPTTELLVDVVGYTTNTGLQQLVADVAGKANTADVYTKAQADAVFVPRGDIVIRQGTSDLAPNSGSKPTSVENFGTGTVVSGDGTVNVSLTGPAIMGGVEYGLRSIEVCVTEFIAGVRLDRIVVTSATPNMQVIDNTDRLTAGCYVFTVNLKGAQAYDVLLSAQGGGTIRFSGVRSTWAPVNEIPTADHQLPAALDPVLTGG